MRAGPRFDDELNPESNRSRQSRREKLGQIETSLEGKIERGHETFHKQPVLKIDDDDL